MIFTFLYSVGIVALGVTGLYELMTAIAMLVEDGEHE